MGAFTKPVRSRLLTSEKADALRAKPPAQRSEGKPEAKRKPHSSKMSRAIRDVGRSVDFAAKKIERAGKRSGSDWLRTFARRLGKGLSLFFGEKTLVSMSFRGGVGLAAAFPGPAKVIGGIGGAINVWSGSVTYYEDHVPTHGKTMHVNAGVGVSTLVYSVGYDRRKELSHSVGISLFSGSVSPRRFAISSGIPLLFGVALGEEHGVTDKDFNKGPFFRVTSRILPFVNMSAEIYYRPLGILTQKLRPLATRARDFNNRVARWARQNLLPIWWKKADDGKTKKEDLKREEQPLGPISWNMTGNEALGFA